VEKFVQMVTTTASRAEARSIARAVVDRRLAACVQIVGPVESTYRWQGKVATAREWLCLIKTTQARYRQLAAAIEVLHHYDTPEIVALPIAAGSRRYLDWLASSVRPPTANRKSAIGNRKSPRGSSCR
jgi:periplasmic divalent cation tolerance protein